MDRDHRAEANGHRYREAKRRFVRKAEPFCTICGAEVDKSLEWPDPLSASVDHVVPLARGGDAMDVALWGLAHLKCNRLKSDSLPGTRTTASARGFLQVDEEGCREYWHPSREWGDEVLPRCPRGYGYPLQTPCVKSPMPEVAAPILQRVAPHPRVVWNATTSVSRHTEASLPTVFPRGQRRPRPLGFIQAGRP